MSMASRIEIPRDPYIDNSFFVLTEGYQYISNRCKKYDTYLFQTRLLGKKVICISGKEAAQIFYDEDKFQRHGATPKFVQKTLFGENGVQTLDDEAHKHRKEMFMTLMTKEHLDEIKEMALFYWIKAIDQWTKKEKIVLLPESEKIMCQIACKWAGVPLAENEIEDKAKDLALLIDSFGSLGPKNVRGRMARKRIEEWVRGVIHKIRQKTIIAPEHSPSYVIAWHKDLNGQLLSEQIAAVELINILRPIVAVGRYVMFGALALHEFNDMADQLNFDDNEEVQMFVQEVRRFYPFTPFLGAIVKKEFFFGGHDFNKGTLVLLDVYGINHDPALWEDPYQFNPFRFNKDINNYSQFIPQGGGDYFNGHRCAGERVTIELMKESLRALKNKMNYTVPKQNLHYSLRRIPSEIESRFIIENVTVK